MVNINKRAVNLSISLSLEYIALLEKDMKKKGIDNVSHYIRELILKESK